MRVTNAMKEELSRENMAYVIMLAMKDYPNDNYIEIYKKILNTDLFYDGMFNPLTGLWGDSPFKNHLRLIEDFHKANKVGDK